jgi:2-methylfumaryl-CoA hydratase
MTDGPTMDLSDPDAFDRALERATTLEKGNHFEAFAEGDRIEHRPGLRLSRHASELWAGQTLNHQPQYWRSDAARERGHDEVPIHPDYLLAAVMGPSVEDLSEKGGYFLGRDDVTVHQVPPAGTEVRVESEVLATADSSSRPAYGIVTWETTGYDAATGDRLVSYERTNMVPRREPLATDGEGADGQSPPAPELPAELVAPDGPYFEDVRAALDRADDRDAAVAYRHERGRTVDDVLLSTLPLSTLNTAGQHHDAEAMADSPSGEMVVYGDVTRSIALGHARSDEHTHREVGYADERFHDFVTAGDTIYGFTRVLDAEGDHGDDALPADVDAPDDTGLVEFEHVAFDQDRTPVYTGRRTALIERQQ